MSKKEKITSFLDYGGSELFSTLMGAGIKRSEAEDRLTELLCSYSELCLLLNGRSRAYRFMLFKAKRKGWLGMHSNDLKAYKLKHSERERVEQKVSAYIKSGGIAAKYAKNAALVLAVVLLLILSGVLIYKRMSSEEYREHLLDYYEEQIIIEYKGKSGNDISLGIRTTENSPLFIYMEHMPRVCYVTNDGELFFDIDAKMDILSQEDERADYTSYSKTLVLKGEEYGLSFFPGQYRLELEFYYYDENMERTDLPTVEKRIMIN